ncbi:hypothetical protein TSUD_06550, partial [Trifolium subterraneum]
MYYKGVYHLFYQHNPYAATFGDIIIWAHSVSYDLINWIHLNNALEPSEPYDINSCWSGSATILPGEKPAILYTGIDHNKHQVQNLAIPKNLSDPFLREWQKHPQNPLMNPPSEVEVDNFRDPSTAWHGKDGKWREKFNPDVTFTGTSKDLRRILWGWVNESDSTQDDIQKGWAGLQTIPRQVWLDKSGKRLIQWPIEEVENLRDKKISITGKKLEGGSTLEISGITASQVDVEVLFHLPELENGEWLDDPSEVDPQLLCSKQYESRSGKIGPFGLLALASKDLTEQTAVSSLRHDLDKTTYGTIFDIDSNLKTISLRTL